MPDNAAVVFTYKSVEHILRDGGTQSWRMHSSHIGTFNYVICTRNRRASEAEGSEEHGAAFLIAKVRDVVLSTDPYVIAETERTGKKRYLIRMTEAAVINIPNFWRWGRWPTHYATLGELGIDPARYQFRPLSELLAEFEEGAEVPSPAGLGAATGPRAWRDVIEATKARLGAELGVNASAIEITVRV